jgi:hypothetical protein
MPDDPLNYVEAGQYPNRANDHSGRVVMNEGRANWPSDYACLKKQHVAIYQAPRWSFSAKGFDSAMDSLLMVVVGFCLGIMYSAIMTCNMFDN